MRIVQHVAATLLAASTTAAMIGPLAGTASAQAPPPCGNSAEACVDLSEDQAWLMSGGTISYGPVPISHGKPGYETPPGVFRITFKDKDHRSSTYNNAPMPYSVFFNGGIAFHEGDVQEQSHGCVHLSHEAAKTFFNDLEPGDVVEVAP